MKISLFVALFLQAVGTCFAQQIPPVPLNGQPYFMASLSSNQTGMTTATPTKVQFANVIFDSCGCYDGVTNFRYTPTTAGKYEVTVMVQSLSSAGTSGAAIGSFIYKNGSKLVSTLTSLPNANSYQNSMLVTAMVTMNGTTDYIEGWGQASGAGLAFIGTGTPLQTWIEAYYVGP